MRLATLLTLIEIECKKLLPWLGAVIVLVTGLSSLVMYNTINSIYREIMQNVGRGTTIEDIVQSQGHITLGTIFNHWNGELISVLYILGILAVAGISFILWEKEWLGQSKRIYLLLSLKGPRFTILISKLITIILGAFIYIGSLIINLGIGAVMLRNIMPRGLIGDNLINSALSSDRFLGVVLPTTPVAFAYRFLFFILMFSMISVFVLSHHSKRIWGFVLGIIYFIAMITIFVWTQNLFLFVDERPWVDFGFVIGGSLISFAISYWLINKKVTI
ncbi:MAG: hypothetical protein FWF59_06550 [Turicibacter sp.]|nr:hypothetical protein [Turicibacter sp.]